MMLSFITAIRRTLLLSCWVGLISGYACSTSQEDKAKNQEVTPPNETGTKIIPYRMGEVLCIRQENSPSIEVNILFYQQENKKVNIWLQFKEDTTSKWIRLSKNKASDTGVIIFVEWIFEDLTHCQEFGLALIDNKEGAIFATNQWGSLSSLYDKAKENEAVDAKIKNETIQWGRKYYINGYRAKGKYIAWKYGVGKLIFLTKKLMQVLTILLLVMIPASGYYHERKIKEIVLSSSEPLHGYVMRWIMISFLIPMCTLYAVPSGILPYIEKICFCAFFN